MQRLSNVVMCSLLVVPMRMCAWYMYASASSHVCDVKVKVLCDLYHELTFAVRHACVVFVCSAVSYTWMVPCSLSTQTVSKSVELDEMLEAMAIKENVSVACCAAHCVHIVCIRGFTCNACAGGGRERRRIARGMGKGAHHEHVFARHQGRPVLVCF